MIWILEIFKLILFKYDDLFQHFVLPIRKKYSNGRIEIDKNVKTA